MERNIFSSKKLCIPGPIVGSVKKRKEEVKKDTSLLHLVSHIKSCSFHEISVTYNNNVLM